MLLFVGVRPSPAVSKRSVRSISPHRPSDSEEEDSSPSKCVPVIADVHQTRAADTAQTTEPEEPTDGGVDDAQGKMNVFSLFVCFDRSFSSENDYNGWRSLY